MKASDWRLPCPWCGIPIRRRARLRAHLVDVHRLDSIAAYTAALSVVRAPCARPLRPGRPSPAERSIHDSRPFLKKGELGGDRP